MTQDVKIWHYGLVAKWWGECYEGGDEVDLFKAAIRRYGQPALDAGCGAGRILRPCLVDGLDVDGSDASAEILDWCRKRAAAQGLLPPRLYAQPMHRLDLPRKYRTIIVCGAFGIGGTRADDLEGLRRMHAHLEPGGTLVIDHHMPRISKDWQKRPELPGPWSDPDRRYPTSEGTELEMSTRTVAFDPLDQTLTWEMRITEYRDGEVIAQEQRSIDICIYFKCELELMLQAAGFASVEVTSGQTGAAPRPWEDSYLVFVARA